MEEETIIIAALSTLSSSKLSDLTHSILSLANRYLHRLSAVLSSPSLFFLTLNRLHSLSLPDKTLLIARHLLFYLQHLTHHFEPTQPVPPPHPSSSSTNTTTYNYYIRHRDLDAVLLLLFLCEVHQKNPEALQGKSSTKWQAVLSQLYSDTMLTLSGVGGAVLMPYIEMVTRCRRFVDVMGGGGKERREIAAAPAAVVALPSVEVKGGGAECVICKDEMREGRDVCELPCKHSFHWMCILPWLRKRNTCPCCRLRLPTDDVFGEIQRLWEILVKASGSILGGESECM